MVSRANDVFQRPLTTRYEQMPRSPHIQRSQKSWKEHESGRLTDEVWISLCGVRSKLVCTSYVVFHAKLALTLLPQKLVAEEHDGLGLATFLREIVDFKLISWLHVHRPPKLRRASGQLLEYFSHYLLLKLFILVLKLLYQNNSPHLDFALWILKPVRCCQNELEGVSPGFLLATSSAMGPNSRSNMSFVSFPFFFGTTLLVDNPTSFNSSVRARIGSQKQESINPQRRLYVLAATSAIINPGF